MGLMNRQLTLSHRRLLQAWRFAAILIAIGGAGALASQQADAHALEVDGSISGVLHIEPDDQPSSGRRSPFIIFIDDASGRFTLSGCDCTLTVRSAGKTLATQALQPDAQGIPAGSFTFPNAGTYDLIVRGAPREQNAFQPFTLDYPERVAQGPVHGSPLWTAAAITISAMVAAISLAACWRQFRPKRR